VTRHVSDSCTDMPLTQVPVRLTAAECSAAAAMTPKTPVAEEAVDRDTGDDVKYVYAPNGLFPCPIPQGSDKCSSVISHFVFMGRLVGKALLDQRHVDLPLAPPFFKKIVGRRLAFEDLELIDPSLHSSLVKMRCLAAAFTDGVEAGRSVADLEKELTLDGCAVADLCLDFTMPGKPEIELLQGGKDMDVTLENLGEYAEAVARMALEMGVSRQFAAFEAGFNEVFPIQHLKIFSPEELEQHIRGDVEPWSMETLRAAIKPDHGYQDSSMPIVWLMTIMSEMDKKERRLFMRFISGSPTLPSGGLRKLQPRLTVVRKDAEAPLKPDDYLPSVMTCANYLKMPQYSSMDIMRERLFVAMREGQLCFLLS
jgi:E3 ubiquitin-protein ligase TRIP12